MPDSILERFEQYRLDYLKSSIKSAYKAQAHSTENFDTLCSIASFLPLKDDAKQVFLIVPSVFNSPDILFIGSPDDIITQLRNFGIVYLVEWQEVHDSTINLNDYALSVAEILKVLVLKHHQEIDLVGHCLGGNLSLAACVINQKSVSSLLLLSTPWDFSYLTKASEIYGNLGISASIANLEKVPALYFQILFFLMQPESFRQKLDYYYAKQDQLNKEEFFAIEDWQFSGYDLPKALYNQLMEEFICLNIMAKKCWVIGENIIDPSLIKKPVMMVIGTKDKIVTAESSRALCDIISSVTLFEYDTGHIGYLVGSQRQNFMLDLKKWIKKRGQNERSLHYAC